MSDYLFLVPLSLALGLIALAAFFWSLRSEQYDDLDGAAERILIDDDRPLVPPVERTETETTPMPIGERADQDD